MAAAAGDDVLFFLKEYGKGKNLPWNRPVKLIALDPGALGCEGQDRLCSSAYSRMWSSLKDANGQIIPNLLRKHGIAPGGRVGFVGFSAAHGLLSPMLNNDADRAMIDSVLLMDACFGSGKVGYQKALVDAAAGKLLFVMLSTTIPGTPPAKSDVLHSGTLCVMRHVIEPTGLVPKPVPVRAPLPEPFGGTWQFGKLGFWVKLPDDAGKTVLPHYELGKLTLPAVEAYLLPRYRGELQGGGAGLRLSGWPWWAYAGVGVLAVGAGLFAWDRWFSGGARA